MSDLDEQIRAYFDALVDCDPPEGLGAAPPTTGSVGRRSAPTRRVLMGGVAACLIAGVLVAVLSKEGRPGRVITVPSSKRAAEFVPNAGVASDVVQAQALRANVVVPVTDGFYLTALREGKRICLQLNAAGRGDGPRSCDMPASAAWPDGSIFAREVILGDRKFAIGAAAAKQVAEVAVDRSGEAPRDRLGVPGMPFPTLRFFVVEAGGAHAIDAFGPTGHRVASTVLRPTSADTPPQTATTVTGASSADVNVGRLLAAFAVQPNDDTFRAIPFAEGPVRLLYQGQPVSGFASAADLRDPSVWEVDQQRTDHGNEVISALTVLRGHPTGDLGFYPGPYTSCATSPEPAEIAYDEHVIIEPNSIDSCSEWFGVDLYLADGRIVAVGIVLASR